MLKISIAGMALGVAVSVAAPCAWASPILPDNLQTAGAVIDGATLLGFFSGNDCSGGSFASCVATQEGVGPNMVGTNPAAVVYKINWENGAPGSTDSGNFASISGGEFTLGLVGSKQSSAAGGLVLSWTYTAGAGDPPINYFTVKQGNGFALFYSADPLSSWSADIWNMLGYNSISHVSWFDLPPDPVTQTPLPASVPLFLTGLAGLWFLRRRRNPRRSAP